MTAFFNPPNAMSSLAEVIAEQIGGLTSISGPQLEAWLPDLPAMPGWIEHTYDGAAVTRLLTRRLGGCRAWDGCEILDVYRISDVVPEGMVVLNADRTLRDGGADSISTHRLDIPPQFNLIATRSSGNLHGNARTVHNYFNHYVINTAAGSALIEQVIAVGADALPMLAGEVAEITENLYRSLLPRAVRAPSTSQ